VVVPELSLEIRELKARAARFVEEELYPVEERIAEQGEIDRHEIHDLKDKARAAGLSNYNVPAEHGGPDLPMLAQVAIEEEGGKATNGLGFIVCERAPRELLELASPGQLERSADSPTRAPGGVGHHRARSGVRCGSDRGDRRA
jgi:alkylation response protein AidB-like acyl-CoA dehydrogenase